MLTGGEKMSKIKNKIEMYGIIKSSIFCYFFAFILGGILGITFLGVYRETIINNINVFSSYIAENRTLGFSFFLTSAWEDIKKLLFLYLISLTAYYIPIAFSFILYHGICTGLLYSTLVCIYGLNGLFLGGVYFFPQGICLAVVYLIMIKFSYQNYNSFMKYEKKKRKKRNVNIILACSIFITLGKLSEFYINYPLVYQWFLGGNK